MYVLICVIITTGFLSKDVNFGCIILFKWVGLVFLGVDNASSTPYVYCFNANHLYVCKRIQVWCTLIFKRVGATLVGLTFCIHL